MPNYLQASYSGQAKTILHPNTILSSPYALPMASGTGHLTENTQPTKFNLLNNRQDATPIRPDESHSNVPPSSESYESSEPNKQQPTNYVITFSNTPDDEKPHIVAMSSYQSEKGPTYQYFNNNSTGPSTAVPAPSSNLHTQIQPLTLYQQQQEQTQGEKKCPSPCLPMCLPECVNAGIDEEGRFNSYDSSETHALPVPAVTNRPVYEVSNNTFPPLQVNFKG